MKFTYITILYFSILASTWAEVTNAQLAQKLDIIIAQLDGLEKRLTNLEKKNVDLSNEIKEVSKIAQQAKSESGKLVPTNTEEKKSFFSNLRMQLNSDQVKSKGGWTEKETWDLVKKILPNLKFESYWEIQTPLSLL